MPKILLVTVGGSFQPIVTAIRTLQPDRVIFLCSDGDRGSKSQVIGTGTPCELRQGSQVIERLPNIPTQAELGDRFQPERDLALIQNPDDLGECYQIASSILKMVKADDPSSEIVADYTGGTKSMSAALVLAAVDFGASLYVTAGVARQNLIKIEQGQVTQRVILER